MRLKTIQITTSVLEVVIGLICMGLGSYFLLSNLECPPEAHDCVGWGILGAAMFLVPGGFIMAAGILSYRANQFPFGVVQTVLVGVLILYFLAGFAFP